jgi:hypothetical protein
VRGAPHLPIALICAGATLPRIRSEFAGEPSRHLIDSCVSRLSAINDKTLARSAKPQPFNSIIISQSWRLRKGRLPRDKNSFEIMDLIAVDQIPDLGLE